MEVVVGKGSKDTELFGLAVVAIQCVVDGLVGFGLAVEFDYKPSFD